MAEIWGAAIVAASAIGTTVYSSQQQKKAAGKVPGVAAAIDPQTEQYNAIQGNLANQADIEQLVGNTNKFQQGQANSLMEQSMPGYGALSKKLTGLATNLADHPYDVPKDVQDNLQRLAAEKGISTGRTGQAGQFSLLRDLGVNQLQYGQTQIGQAQGLTGLLASIAPKVNPMSPMSMYISPQQQINTTEGNTDRTQGGLNANSAAAQYQAAANANMWGNIGGAIGGLATNPGVAGGVGSLFKPNPSGMDTSKNGSVNDMNSYMDKFNKNGL